MHLLVTGAWNDASKHIAALEQMGYQVHFLQQEADPLPCDPSIIECVVCNGLFLQHDIRQFSNLRLIQLASAGYDRVPMDYVQRHGIEIHNAKDVYSIPMAEFVLYSVLQVYKQSRYFSTLGKTPWPDGVSRENGLHDWLRQCWHSLCSPLLCLWLPGFGCCYHFETAGVFSFGGFFG